MLENYRNRKILVTGGASFIGSALVELIVEHGGSVTVADNLSSGTRDNLAAVSNDISFLEGDVRDPVFASQATKNTEIMFHLAASHGGRGYIDTHPVECVNNMLLDHVIFEAAAKSGVEKIVHASSACVYPTNLQDDETNRYLLREVDANFDEPGKAYSDGEYGWAKLMGELQLGAFHKQYGLDGIACRIFTAYGERENESHAVIALIAKALAKLDPFPVWGNGEQTRNFTYVGDTVMGMALAGIKLKGCSAINLGTDRHHTINELAETIFAQLNWRPEKMDYQLDMPVGVKSRASDNTRIQDLLGWKPETRLDVGLEKTIHWYREVVNDQRLAELDIRLMQREDNLEVR
jgi:UDP-glucose 4-epimerase